MRISTRAAAIAAAAVGLFSAGGLTAPSIASEAEATAGISYIEHAASVVQIQDLAIDAFETNEARIQGPSTDGPIAVHAFAPALPGPATGERSSTEDSDLAGVREGQPLSELVARLSDTIASDEETDCLARAVYYESKGESLQGQLTVADVIVNRARSGRFRPTICGVVRQPGQFSFVRGGNIPTPPAQSRDWRIAVAIAEVAMRDLADGAAPRALFFHARHVSPGWRLTRVATVGNHVFYR